MGFWSCLLDLVYPRVCAGCGREAGGSDGHLCWDCRRSLQAISAPFCSRCGDPIDGVAEHTFTCSWCTAHPPSFDRARSAIRYRGALRRVVHAYKYRGACCLSRDLSDFLLAVHDTHFAHAGIDAVVSVPLHKRRERERTYDQSALLATNLGRRLGLPAHPRCLIRTRATATQTKLKAAKRRENILDAFRVAEPAWVKGRRFLLVDDVMTTGATVNECAKVLKEAGAALVLVATVGRG